MPEDRFGRIPGDAGYSGPGSGDWGRDRFNGRYYDDRYRSRSRSAAEHICEQAQGRPLSRSRSAAEAICDQAAGRE